MITHSRYISGDGTGKTYGIYEHDKKDPPFPLNNMIASGFKNMKEAEEWVKNNGGWELEKK